MPIGLIKTDEESQVQQEVAPDAPEAESQNPLAPSARAQAFCTWILSLTQNNERKLTEEEFQELQKAYDKLEGIERLEVRTLLQRHGIDWSTTLEWEKDGYDDINNGYTAYTRIKAGGGWL